VLNREGLGADIPGTTNDCRADPPSSALWRRFVRVPCAVVCVATLSSVLGCPATSVATTRLLFVMIGLAQSFLGRRATIVNLIILVVILLILFGGGGFYYGGPYVGGGLGTVLLIILVVLLLRG
jgi:hypothetical protein